MDQRKYDVSLVDAIRDKQHMEDVGGVPTLVKPIPDDDRDHVLDPRVAQVAARKKAMFAQRAKDAGGYSLANERFRPDKVTYDLCEHEVVVKEQLIDVDGTHMIDVFTYRDVEAEGALPVVCYFHGGGFTAGDERIYHNQMRFLAEKAGALVVFPVYRLAPEAPFPAGIDDCWATVRWAHEAAAELGADPDRIMVAGDSAGGGLSCACLVKDDGGLIKQAFLLYPVCDSTDYVKQTRYHWSYDHYPVIEEHRELAASRIDRIRVGSEGATAEGSIYVQGKTSLEDPLVSVIYAGEEVMRRFPPVTIAYSEYDYLRMGAEYFARQLAGLGKDVRPICYKGCDHGVLDFFGSEPQAEDIMLEMAADARGM